MKKRDAQNAFREVWSTLVDPADMFIDRSPPPSPRRGDPARHGAATRRSKVDVLILGDGYTAAERPKFEKDARRLVDILFATSPFKERRADFNVWGLCPPAAESGISRPSTGVWRRSPAGSHYDAFGSERYVLTFDNRAFRDLAAFAPYEFVEILVNGQTYGGGGIFNLYATVAADSAWAPYIFVHEFGHHFAGLADEYYTSDVAYLPASDPVEPWEPNATVLRDPATPEVEGPGDARARRCRRPGTRRPSRRTRATSRCGGAPSARPTSPRPRWTRSSASSRRKRSRMLGAERYAQAVGAFEGAHVPKRAATTGRRSTASCSRATRFRSAPCAGERSRRVIDLYAAGREPLR